MNTPSSIAPPEPLASKGAGACGDGMVLVEGAFCPAVVQSCLEHTKEYDRDQERRAERSAKGEALAMSRVSERCLRYANPTRCLSTKRTPMRFCIDRYEWPNRAGERPDFAMTWLEAEARCTSVGKRLCDVDEFTFACEGEEMRPYAYGFERDATRCNIDKPYVQPMRKATPHEACMKDASCKAELEGLDQRVSSGSMPCASPFGVMDMNGNVNEWVNRPGQREPWRSGLKGGWWGPARSRCRPTVTAHNEIYAGYEVGFRCCSSAKP
ncbi:MAG: SUMF1/EgtB/PvdO family nonheme iron enzyme [Deltaproteobacteria bacterium]|nr:SUMF1/EgtB/PvdO family nonheme iron enzyme [Deltaproteobacteria bacterium]